MIEPIDYDEIRAAVAKRHNLLLDKDDPVLVTATLCDVMFERYTAQLVGALAEVEQRGAAALSQQIETAKKAAEGLIVGASQVFHRAAGEAASSAGASLAATIDTKVATAIRAATTAEAAMKWTVLAAVLLGGAILLLAGVLLGKG